jgi:nucleotide-binding universal stress UspA family protein
LVEELTNLAAKLGLSVPVTIRVEEGHPWSLICETAGVLNAEVIVISSHGYTGLKRMLLGSTAEQVVRHATCPVLVVKSFQ